MQIMSCGITFWAVYLKEGYDIDLTKNNNLFIVVTGKLRAERIALNVDGQK